MSAVAPLATDMYLPAMERIAESFGAEPFHMQLTLSAFFVAFSFGQLVYGPLSDTFGRKIPALFGIAIFALASLALNFTDDIAVFIALRFVQALGGCAGVVIARAVINDTFGVKDAAAAFALMMVVGSLAPMLAPTLGSFVENTFGWRFIFDVLAFCGVLLWLFVFFGLKESNRTRKSFSHKAILQGYKKVATDTKFLTFMFSGALAMSMIFAYIAGSSFVFMTHFGLTNSSYGLIFGLNALGMMTGSNINAFLVRRFSPYSILPYAFCAMSVFCVLLVVGGVLNLGFWVFEVNLFFMISSLGFVVPNVTSLAMARFKSLSGTASALFGFTQFALAGAVSALVGVVEANSPLPLALVMSGSLVCASVVYFAKHWFLVRRFFMRWRRK